MKKIIYLLSCVLVVNILLAQQDTAILKLGNSKILIISEDVAVKDKNNIIVDTIKKKEKKDKFNAHWGGIDIGFNGYLAPSFTFELPENANFMELYFPKSLNINLNLFDKSIKLYRNSFGIVTGLGLGYYNYRFNKNIILKDDSTVLSYSIDTVNKFKKNKLLINKLRIPLLLECQIPVNDKKDKLYVAAGVIGMLNIGSHTKQVIYKDGDRSTYKDFRSFYLMPLNYSIHVRMGFHFVGVYVEYQPTMMFQTNKGPELYPWSAGFSLSF